jgi:hypothetical protein
VFNYTNHLPLGFYLDFYLLGEDNENILDNNAAYQNVTIERPEVDQEGRVITPMEGPIFLTFNKESETSLTLLQKAKYLRISYKSVKNDELKKPIRLKKTDYLSLKMGVIINGRILY